MENSSQVKFSYLIARFSFFRLIWHNLTRFKKIRLISSSLRVFLQCDYYFSLVLFFALMNHWQVFLFFLQILPTLSTSFSLIVPPALLLINCPAFFVLPFSLSCFVLIALVLPHSPLGRILEFCLFLFRFRWSKELYENVPPSRFPAFGS